MMDALLESKILDLFEKTKGDFNAHGMGVSCGDVPILGLYPQPQALRTIFYPSWNMGIKIWSYIVIGGEVCKM